MDVNELLARFSEQQVAAFFLVLALVAVVAIAGPWMLSTMVSWTTELWAQIPRYVGT